MSTMEAVYHKTPMLVMPGVNDQFSNAERTKRMGYGLSLLWTELTEESLRSL